MSENKGGGVGGLLLLALALALIAGSLLAAWLIGSAALTTMGMILVAAIALAVVIAASALPIRAWRRKDPTGETRIIHEGTKTVIKTFDGRPVADPNIELLQKLLPPTQNSLTLYPAGLRAALAAVGMLPDKSASNSYGEADLEELDVDAPSGWEGDIRV